MSGLRDAPSVSYPVGRSRFWATVLTALALAVVLTGAWMASTLPPEAWLMRIVAGVVPPTNEPTGVSVQSAVERLGLRLQTRRMPVDTIVIDRIERVPSDN